MRILDVDLDFFLDEVAYFGQERSEIDAFNPWDKEVVQNWLERYCGLSKDIKIPGSTVNRHNEVYTIWKSLIASKRLEVPFEVVHVDAHSDLGSSGCSFEYITTVLLQKPYDERLTSADDSGFINEGNYLAFAVACRLLKKLTWIMHIKSDKDDFHPNYWTDCNPESNSLSLPWRQKNSLIEMNDYKCDPPVSFQIYDYVDFVNKNSWDFMFLSKSPNYCPMSAFTLLQIIEEYMCDL
jgi:hypothetical protein